LSRILAGTGLTYHHYVTLTLTAASGGTADRDQLVSRLAAALKIEDAPLSTKSPHACTPASRPTT
jgi:hypothetical protein